MLHKIFQWWYHRNRSSYGQSYKKIDHRSKDRDLIHYFHDFGGDGLNTHSSHWLRRKITRGIYWIIFIILAAWFTYESYLGLLIYDQ